MEAKTTAVRETASPRRACDVTAAVDYGQAAGGCALIAVLCAAVGFGSGRSPLNIGGPSRIVDTSAYGGDVLVALLAVGLAGAGYIAYLLRPPRRRRRDDDEPEQVVERPPVPWWFAPTVIAIMLALLTGLVAAVVFLPRHASQPLPSEPGRPPAQSSAAHHSAIPTSDTRATLAAVHWWGLAFAAVILLSGALAAWWLSRRRRAEGRTPAASPILGLRAAVELSLEEIEREPDPRRAVIKAYSRMETTLADHGVVRRRSETPIEYLTRTLRTIQVSATATRRLTQLFQQAKFSRHTVDAAMKADALGALRNLRDELETEP